MQALLILPQPPQCTTFSHVWTALYPTLSSTLQKLVEGQTGDSAVLDIALPLTRIAQTTRSHYELFARVKPLLANIYRLLATVFQELCIPLEGPGSVNARVLLIRDEDEEIIDERIFPFVVTSLNTLASSPRSWTDIYAVDSEQGNSTYQRFQSLVRGSDRQALFRRVQRVAGGMQIYVPSIHPNGIDTFGEDAALQEVGVLIGGDAGDHFTDKYLLTMGLLAIREAEDDPALLARRHIRVAASSGRRLEGGSKTKVLMFLWSITGLLRSTAAPFEEYGGVEVSFPVIEELASSPIRMVISESARALADNWREKGMDNNVVVLRLIEAGDKDVDD